MNGGMKDPTDTGNAMNKLNPGNNRKEEKRMNALIETMSVALLITLGLAAQAAEPPKLAGSLLAVPGHEGVQSDRLVRDSRPCVGPDIGEGPVQADRQARFAYLHQLDERPDRECMARQ